MSRVRTFAVVGCATSVIIAGVALAFIRRRRSKMAETTPSGLPPPSSPPSSSSFTAATVERRYIFWQPKESVSIQQDKLADLYFFGGAEAVALAPLLEDEEDWDLGEEFV